MIDVNAYLGHFAFRRLHNNTAATLLQLMDRAGIERAVVSSASAITFRNAQPGNDEVFEEIRSHTDRFTGFAVLNPAYAGWKDDLRLCQERYRMRGLRLYPRWHGYKLNDPEALEMVRLAAAAGMLISIPQRVEDRRQQSHLVDIPDVSHDEIAALIRAVPSASFLILSGQGFPNSVLGRKNNGLPPNYAVDICLMRAELDNEVGQLIANLGEDRILFGTGMPFHVPDASIAKLDVLDVSAAVKEKIRGANAARLLRLRE